MPARLSKEQGAGGDRAGERASARERPKSERGGGGGGTFSAASEPQRQCNGCFFALLGGRVGGIFQVKSWRGDINLLINFTSGEPRSRSFSSTLDSFRTATLLKRGAGSFFALFPWKLER